VSFSFAVDSERRPVIVELNKPEAPDRDTDMEGPMLGTIRITGLAALL